MSTRAYASAVIPVPLEKVWKALRDFSFPHTLKFTGIESCSLDSVDGKQQHIGVCRILKWADGEVRKHRLLELSDIYNHMTWELVEAEPPTETLAHISKIKCLRITETNSTLIEWIGEFSSGTSQEFVTFEQKAYHRNIADIRNSLTQTPLPTLYHVHEGPSTRVAWVASHLGLPLSLKIVTPSTDKMPELSFDQGGVITRYVEGKLVLLESGATVMHIIEKYDQAKILDPFPRGSDERAKYLQWFFYSSSTVDHVLFEGYKQSFVYHNNKRDSLTLNVLQNEWEDQISKEFEKELKDSVFICGDRFTGADIMCGWCVYFASTIGWLDNHPILQAYLNRLKTVVSFQRAFSAADGNAPFYLV
eukprot:TRINITY_DN5444_c0_g1_i1.p1 TRINITY_DN5444_c0_g1~~TRINITY_DN5444_c0_g1_i1.p1  ORF type:complete len:362 (+),score=70.09 TRINITY_DN5444_c0_g1_i1:144-1229(+)